MAQDTPPPGLQQVNRIFEQGPDSVSFYSDAAQVFNTGHEVVLQFYETIPGAPGPGGKIQLVKSRLRATITISMGHASNIGNLLLKQIQIKATPPKAKK
ncbi:MAG: hypothetical protein KAV87_51890 [Desulfobacteraceae bacterium]|nr:hypothetical protein [Desulfobacteraceae bacterium]